MAPSVAGAGRPSARLASGAECGDAAGEQAMSGPAGELRQLPAQPPPRAPPARQRGRYPPAATHQPAETGRHQDGVCRRSVRRTRPAMYLPYIRRTYINTLEVPKAKIDQFQDVIHSYIIQGHLWLWLSSVFGCIKLFSVSFNVITFLRNGSTTMPCRSSRLHAAPK